MTGSSELSGALNPYFYQQDQVNTSPTYDQHVRIVAASPRNHPQQQQQQQQQQFTPHRSELADAINPAAITPHTPARNSVAKQSAAPLQLLKGLIRSIASYKAAVEEEKKRRLAWEHEQETKYISRQRQLEKRIEELERELDELKTERDSSRSGQGSSSGLVTGDPSQPPEESILLFDPIDKEREPAEFVEGSSSSTSLQKRPRSGSPHNSSEQEPAKLRVPRSCQPQTIMAAMRAHILRCMDLDHDKQLPPSHVESVKLPSTQPVRFVWDQTTKKSLHNARMKARIIADLIGNKDLYPLVQPEEFTDVKLEVVFEQAYTTLRQKYASQHGLRSERSKDMKARRVRRMSRKKYKLASRVATRKELDPYNTQPYDFAFQLDCMSSEESSDGEDDAAAGDGDNPSSNKALRIRVLAWRSARLQELFRIIDEHEQLIREKKPKRGLGRKNRHIGPPKDGNPPPPKGTPQWMVSKKWLRQAVAVRPQIASLVVPTDEGGQQAVSVLGPESEDEQEVPPQPLHYAMMPIQQYFMIDPLHAVNVDAYQHAQYMYAPHDAWVDSMAGYVDLSQFSSPMMQTYPSGNPPVS